MNITPDGGINFPDYNLRSFSPGCETVLTLLIHWYLNTIWKEYLYLFYTWQQNCLTEYAQKLLSNIHQSEPRFSFKLYSQVMNFLSIGYISHIIWTLWKVTVYAERVKLLVFCHSVLERFLKSLFDLYFWQVEGLMNVASVAEYSAVGHKLLTRW